MSAAHFACLHDLQSSWSNLNFLHPSSSGSFYSRAFFLSPLARIIGGEPSPNNGTSSTTPVLAPEGALSCGWNEGVDCLTNEVKALRDLRRIFN
ncbi:hypothetical protein PMIN03_004180 [Paraphaeosphaeria minitans]